MEKPRIIRQPDELHRRNNVPSLEGKIEAKQDGKQHKHTKKDHIRCDHQIRYQALIFQSTHECAFKPFDGVSTVMYCAAFEACSAMRSDSTAFEASTIRLWSRFLIQSH